MEAASSRDHAPDYVLRNAASKIPQLFDGIDNFMLRRNMTAWVRRADEATLFDIRSLEMQGNALQAEATEFDRTEGRARFSHIGNAGGLQSQGGHLWRLDHGIDGFRREDVGDTPCRWARCDGFRLKHHISAAGACR